MFDAIYSAYPEKFRTENQESGSSERGSANPISLGQTCRDGLN